MLWSLKGVQQVSIRIKSKPISMVFLEWRQLKEKASYPTIKKRIWKCWEYYSPSHRTFHATPILPHEALISLYLSQFSIRGLLWGLYHIVGHQMQIGWSLCTTAWFPVAYYYNSHVILLLIYFASQLCYLNEAQSKFEERVPHLCVWHNSVQDPVF